MWSCCCAHIEPFAGRVLNSPLRRGEGLLPSPGSAPFALRTGYSGVVMYSCAAFAQDVSSKAYLTTWLSMLLWEKLNFSKKKSRTGPIHIPCRRTARSESLIFVENLCRVRLPFS